MALEDGIIEKANTVDENKFASNNCVDNQLNIRYTLFIEGQWTKII